VTYTWDNNGNLVNDGASTYTYDHANRLKSVVQGATTYGFSYNGVGDRLRQTINAAPTTYTVDLAAGLTQVLADGANSYLYGVGRIGEEQPGGWQYHLGDALGSVRQLANATPAVTLARSYEPFGDTLTNAGSGSTAFQFTGEARDGTGLTYLRARYYASAVGRFMSRDTWEGSSLTPISYNPWTYTEQNAVNHIHPSGQCPRAPTWAAGAICVDLFISTSEILGGLGRGDGRGFSYDSLPTQSRGYLYAFFDRWGRFTGYVPHVDNPSCTVVGCFGPYDEFNEFTAAPNTRGDRIQVEWHLLNGLSGVLRSDIPEWIDLVDLLDTDQFHVFEIAEEFARCAAGIGGALIGFIDGEMSLQRDPDTARWDLERLDRDPYPSLEVYYYQDGTYEYTVAHGLRDEYRGPGGAFVGLSPLAPNDRYP
jgi:RHS repeat-associated protein